MKSLQQHIEEKLIINQKVDEKLLINKNFNDNNLSFIYDSKWKKNAYKQGIFTMSTDIFYNMCDYIDEYGEQLQDLNKFTYLLNNFSYVAVYNKHCRLCCIYHYNGNKYEQLVFYINTGGTFTAMYYDIVPKYNVHVLDPSSIINENNPKFFGIYNETFKEIKKAYDTIARKIIKEDLSDVKTKWHPKEGLFSGDNPKEIADYLLKNSKDSTQAMRRLCFYMNRAGDKLKNKEVLNKVKELLKNKNINEKLIINKEFKGIGHVNDIFEERFENDLEYLMNTHYYNGGFKNVEINYCLYELTKRWDTHSQKLFEDKYNEYMNLYEETHFLKATCYENDRKREKTGDIYNSMRDFLHKHYNEMEFIYSFDGNDYYIIYLFETSKHIFTIAGQKYYHCEAEGAGNIIMLNKQ